MKVLLLFSMFWFHVLDEFYMQGILARLKCKRWWVENTKEMYHNDWSMALMIHALMWSITLHIPVVTYLYFTNSLDSMYGFIVGTIAINQFIHLVVDDMKCNKYVLNLTQEQLLHIIQIVCTYIFYTII